MSPNKRTRFAIYCRYSSDMQNELSLEDQEVMCREEIAKRGGVIVGVYKDGAETGWSLDRDGFNKMRKATERGKFDALMMWKFDRLARDHNHTVMIKVLLRHEYGLKLFCVEGFSEDDSDDPYVAMMEQMLAVFSAFYSRNLSTDTKRAKRLRATRGEFNGSIPPIGYILVTKRQATEERPAGLYIDPEIAPLVRQAFWLYRSGMYSDADIAEWMNRQSAIQALRQGRQPVNKEMVRDMLQNRVYTGRVPYAETRYNGGLGQGKKSSRGRKTWFEGKHEAIVEDDLFEACLAVRASLKRGSTTPGRKRIYLLHDRVYCAACVANKPLGLVDDFYGKMRPYWHKDNETAYYRCRARERGYESCGQGHTPVEDVDDQVVAILTSLSIPEGFRERVEAEVRGRVENEASLARMQEIQEIMERIDFRWDRGYISPDEYVEKREQLVAEMEAMRPIDYDDLTEAADLIENFQTYWDQCEQVDNPLEARKQLLQKIVARVFLYDGDVLAVVLHGDFGVVLGESGQAEGEIAGALEQKMATDGISHP